MPYVEKVIPLTWASHRCVFRGHTGASLVHCFLSTQVSRRTDWSLGSENLLGGATFCLFMVPQVQDVGKCLVKFL